MISMSSGDWTKIMPDDFYSLIDSLQDMKGLDRHEVDMLQESYTKYLMTQGAFENLDQDDFYCGFNSPPPSVSSTNSDTSSPYQSPHASPACAQQSARSPHHSLSRQSGGVVLPSHGLPLNIPDNNNKQQQQQQQQGSSSRSSTPLTNSFPTGFLTSSSLDEVLKGGMYTNMNNIQAGSPKSLGCFQPNLDISGGGGGGGSPGGGNAGGGSGSSSNHLGKNFTITDSGNSSCLEKSKGSSNFTYRNLMTPLVEDMGMSTSLGRSARSSLLGQGENTSRGYTTSLTQNTEDDEDDFDWSSIL